MLKLNREDLIQDIAQNSTDSIELGDLMQFFFQHQEEWLEQLNNNELLEQAQNYLCDFNIKDYIK